MSITIDIDPALWKAAEELTDIHDPSELVRQLIEREVARAARMRLAAAGGTMPDLEVPPRKRPGTEL